MSNNSTGCIFAFVLGAAAGSAVAWNICKRKYEQIAREEIASVKEVFSERLKNMKVAEEPKEPEIETEATVENFDETEEIYRDIAKDYGGGKETQVPKPYVISPDEFGEDEEYECLTLTYYADGVLTDEVDEPIENVEAVVGKESLRHFGDYAEDTDSVFVKNDKDKCYYEILYDQRNYSDVCGR